MLQPKLLARKIAHAVPVNDYIQVSLGGPLHALVEQAEIIGRPGAAPVGGMHGEADCVGVPGFCRVEIRRIPMAALFEDGGIAGCQSAKDNRFTAFRNELISLHADVVRC